MPLNPTDTQGNPGDPDDAVVPPYPLNIRHISNGDPCNENFLRAPSVDLESRCEALRKTLNEVEADLVAAQSALSSFDTGHSHGGGSDGSLIDLAQLYANSVTGQPELTTDAVLTLLEGGKVTVYKKDTTSDPILQLLNDGTTPATRIIFPGSSDTFAHVYATASETGIRPHGIQLAGRVIQVSAGCLVGSTATPDHSVILNAAGSVGGVNAAPGLSGKTPGDGDLTEGVVVATIDNTQASPKNIVVVRNSANLPITVTTSVGVTKQVYGLLKHTGSNWVLEFFTEIDPAADPANPTGAYSFPASTPTTLLLYGVQAYGLNNLPVVDDMFIKLAKVGTTLY